MSEYTYIPDTEHAYPNLTIKKVLHDGALAFYDLRSNDGYVMYRTDANDMEMDEYGEWHHTYGVKATMPMYNADMEILMNINRVAREVFSK